MVAAAASKPTLPLIPKIVSPTWISLPIAYLEANLFNFSIEFFFEENFLSLKLTYPK